MNQRYLKTVENLVVGPPCGVMDEMAFACGEPNDLLAMVCQEFGQLYMSRASLDSLSSATFEDKASRSRHQTYVLTSFRLEEQSAWLDDLLGDWVWDSGLKIKTHCGEGSDSGIVLDEMSVLEMLRVLHWSRLVYMLLMVLSFLDLHKI